jgi:hypothetical protein
MIDHVWTVVCSRAIVDRSSNNVSIQNVLEQFSVRAEPKPDALIAVPFEVMTLWARSDFSVPASGSERLTLYSPSGVKIGERVFALDLMGNVRRYRTRASFNGLPASEPGRYAFRVELQEGDDDEWRAVAAVPLEVIFEQPEPDQGESEEG